MFFRSLVLICVGLVSHATLAKEKIDYPLIDIPKGSFELKIPIYSSKKVIYIKKKVKFDNNFKIGKFEVTNALWTKCYEDKGCIKPAFYVAEEGKNNPSVRLNWHDAYQFSIWLSKVTKKKYRLPTEEEWAYAAYMGKDTGDRSSDKVITYDYNPKKIKNLAAKITRPVGSNNKNAWGMNDYFGNVWEWTLTCWYGSQENMLKKRTIKELNTPKACTTRIARGETRSHIPDFISDTYNGGCATLRPAANLGFRLVRED